MDIAGRWALVTGASSGLGVDFARELAQRGCHLILVARRQQLLEKVADRLRQDHGVEVEVEVQDLAEPGGCSALHQRVQAKGHEVAILVNNAGFGNHGYFVDHEVDRELRLIRLNVMALVELSHLFGQGMAARGEGWILQIASIAGLIPLPSYAVYGASKAFVVSFSEAISLELARAGVQVTVLCPGITWTEFFDVSGQKPTLYNRIVGMQSADVARIGIRSLLRGKPSVIAGWRNVLTMGISRLLPRRFVAWMTWQLMRND